MSFPIQHDQDVDGSFDAEVCHKNQAVDSNHDTSDPNENVFFSPIEGEVLVYDILYATIDYVEDITTTNVKDHIAVIGNIEDLAPLEDTRRPVEYQDHHYGTRII